jgi:protein-S-isoprenylcysteine O-methyltransferase Ste14
MRAFEGYSSWRSWLSGKAIPLAIFTLLLTTNSLVLPREAAHLAREGIRLYPLMELLRHFLTLGFLLLVVAAYLTRSHAVAPTRGFGERAFPMLVLLVTFLAMPLLERATVPHRLELIAVGLLLTILGYCVSLWALWHLRGSFAILAEARSPVISGPYRYVRHPLYLGESLSMLGLCIAMRTATALFFWAAWTAMQLARARIKERKLALQFNDYSAYQQRTPFILPGFC